MGKVIEWPQNGAPGCDPRKAEILKQAYRDLTSNRIGRRVPENNWVMAYATIAGGLFGATRIEISPQEAEVQVRKFLERLLLDGEYLLAAVLMWGDHYFFTEPRYIRDVFATVRDSSMMIAIGGSSTSKTYGLAAYLYLDWRLDPAYTSVKVIGPNEQHMRDNVFAQLKDLHQYASIPLDARVVSLTISLPMEDGEVDEDGSAASGIQGILVPKTLDGASRVKGYKARPRPFGPHPKFGPLGRLRILVDEGQDAPDGMWEDFGSIISSISDKETIKIMVAGNPTKRNCKMVEYAEPDRGWREEDIDVLKRWVSKKGWDVIRCDGLDSENVKEKRQIYRGIITYEGMVAIQEDGSQVKWWGNFRGWPPMSSNQDVVVQPSWFDKARGEPNFDGKVTWVAAIDPAFEGADKAVVTIGRYGIASTWRTPDGEDKKFLTPDAMRAAIKSTSEAEAQPRWVLCVDTQLCLSERSDPIVVAEEAANLLTRLGIEPENVIVDAGSGGTGTIAQLRRIYGEVQTILGQHKASEMPISQDDPTVASTKFVWAVDEMWFTAAEWLRAGFLKISPSVSVNPLQHQLITRRYTGGSGEKYKVEQKKMWKNRNNNKSPDEADLLVMLVQLVRRRFGNLPSAVEKAADSEDLFGAFRTPEGTIKVPDQAVADKWAIFRSKNETREVILDTADNLIDYAESGAAQSEYED